MSTALRTTTYCTLQSLLSRSLITLAVIAFSAIASFAQGDLLISPLRIIFEGSKKSQEISLANVGKDTATYAISVVDIRMKEDGSFETVTTPDSGQQFAGPYMRFFPRRVVLAPNEAQVVKVQLMRTSQLKQGEYRSHLYFRAVPDEAPLGEKKSKKDSASISIQLKPIFGITIPVIIRSGENNADVSLTEMSVEMGANNKPILSLRFNRTGDMSVYGDLTITYTTASGKSSKMKFVKGIGVYTPNPSRVFRVELDDEKSFDIHAGKLKAVYTLQTNEKNPRTREAQIELK